jgi:mannonate dehydratase
MGVEGVVTALHGLPPGAVWPESGILSLKARIEAHGMRWSVVESLPVAEGIKTRSRDCPRLIENYRQSLRNLGRCGIDTVCYNFLPVLDWARTGLHVPTPRGGETMRFDYPTFAAFDIHILGRKDAAASYDAPTRRKAAARFAAMTAAQQEELAHSIIIVTQAFVNGAVEAGVSDYKKQFLYLLDAYREIGPETLREHLAGFLAEVLPAAEEAGIRLCIHPDDPPFPLLGLPRIAGTLEDLRWITACHPSPANGITFCTGSLSGREDNDVVLMARLLAGHIHFVHLRNTVPEGMRSFAESEHLAGQVDMFSVIRILLTEQAVRLSAGHPSARMPFRPDHGIRILDDFTRTANPGYPLYGRMVGLAGIDGMQQAISRMIASTAIH